MNRHLTAAAFIAAAATPAVAAPQNYVLDSSHAQIVFSYDHLGYSTGFGMFSGFEGEIVFDMDDPAASSVTVAMPVMSMLTGWEARFAHFMSPDFFDAAEGDMITFTSTSIEITGENSALITGDLTLNAVTQSVVLDAVLNQASDHPMEGKPWAGFDATTTLLRSDYGLDAFAPFVSDAVDVVISVEAMQEG